MVNGRPRILRGQSGESAVVRMNGKVVNINTPLEANCEIVIEPSTIGEDAAGTVEQLEEYTESTIVFEVNKKTVICPRFVEVNGVLEPPSYRIQEGDKIELRNYYTIGQLVEFMDVELDMDQEILVNNRDADMATLVYENFSVEWTVVETRTHIEDLAQDEAASEEPAVSESGKEIEAASEGTQTESEPAATPEEPVKEEKEEPAGIQVIVNKEPIFMSGKAEYIYVDVFDYIEFNLNDSRGRNIVTHLNGQNTEYTAPLKDGDVVDIYWEENN